MKEKNKNLLKGIGVGVLACVGMVGLTGCSEVEISQEKIDSTIETIEKVDTRLDDYISLLEQQNQELKDQNRNLEDLLENAKKMTKEEVWNLAQTADFNLKMNNGGLRDNLIITLVERNLNQQMDILCYYNSDDLKVHAEFSGDNQGVVTRAELWYQTNETNVILANINTKDLACNSVQDRGAEADFEASIGVYRGNSIGINTYNLTFNDLNHYEVLDNGNVVLTFVKSDKRVNPDDEEEYFIALKDYALEYSLDGKLLSLKRTSRIIEKEGDFEHRIGMLEESIYNEEYVLRYGEINTDLVKFWVELAEAKRSK